jgi:hypothetical protein
LPTGSFQAALGTIDVLAVYLGDRMGWYRALAEAGPANAAELTAQRAPCARVARTTGLYRHPDPDRGLVTFDCTP